jgi:hypothetical protein
MREVTIGDYTFPVEGSAWALMVYADSFGADLLQDAVREYIGKPVNVSFLLKCAWAMAKGYSDTIPAFDQWIKGLGKINLTDATRLDGWAGEVDKAISTELFCVPETVVDSIDKSAGQVVSGKKRNSGTKPRTATE